MLPWLRIVNALNMRNTLDSTEAHRIYTYLDELSKLGTSSWLSEDLQFEISNCLVSLQSMRCSPIEAAEEEIKDGTELLRQLFLMAQYSSMT